MSQRNLSFEAYHRVWSRILRDVRRTREAVGDGFMEEKFWDNCNPVYRYVIQRHLAWTAGMSFDNRVRAVAWLYGRALPYLGLRSETFPSARDMDLQLEHFVSGKKHGRVDGNKTKARVAVAEQRRSFCFAYLRGKCSRPEGTCKYEHREPRKDECRKCGRRGHQEKDCWIKHD